jgi:hypothetical protein
MTTQPGEKKYYVPEIEEFHYGFSYEVNMGNDNWTEFRCHSQTAGFYLERIAEKRLRVPYLSEQDILDEGWELIEPQDAKYTIDNYYSLSADLKNGNEDVRIEYKLRYWEGINSVAMWSDDTDSEFFNGTIRNRSELRQIMRMVGIK